MSAPSPPAPVDATTRRWWTLLRGGAALNLALLLATAVLAWPQDSHHQAQLALATVYSLVCAFRSWRPRVDLERMVLVDHPLSGIVLGRSAATVAELAFTAQCALFVADLGERTGQPWLLPLAAAMVPLIALAQGCCWLGVLTLDHGWHAAEEALWALFMAMLAAAFLGAWPGAGAVGPAVLALAVVGAAGGAFVMVALDIPMYLRRRRTERAAGRQTLSVAAGFADALRRRVPVGDWATWRPEAVWMTPYFTAAVWISLAMVWL